MSQDEQDLQLGKMIRQRRECNAKVAALQGKARDMSNALRTFADQAERFIQGELGARTMPNAPAFSAADLVAVLEELGIVQADLRMLAQLIGD